MKTTKIMLSAIAIIAFAACTKETTPEKSNVLPGIFSVSADKKIQFSKGNLQATFNGSSYTWGFAENQYDFVGKMAGNTTIDNQTAGSVVDLFGWSTPNTNYGIHTSDNNEDPIYTGDFKDWGTATENMGSWFTLSKEEWDFLIGNTSPRSNTLCKYDVSVCGKRPCLVIAPDNFTGTIAESYDADAWSSAEAAGLVCIPPACRRMGASVFADSGHYWSSTTAQGNYEAYELYLGDTDPNSDFYGFWVSKTFRRNGFSVRLVTAAK